MVEVGSGREGFSVLMRDYDGQCDGLRYNEM